MEIRKVVLLAGARPNHMKIFPIWREMVSRPPRFRPVVVHTGQHYDPLMSEVIFRDLGMPTPDHILAVGSGSHAQQTARVMATLDPILDDEAPECLIAVGDVNSTMAGALVASKMGIPVAHVEAGLRSFDRTMPEEINRIVTDSISDLLFTNCPDADQNLLKEGVPSHRIHFVGNTMIDSLVKLLPDIRTADIAARMGLRPGAFVLVTIHRPTNVDDAERLVPLVSALEAISEDLPVVFPVHPRTKKRLEAMEYAGPPPPLQLIGPLGYSDFLSLLAGARLVITDSGGVQEESSFLGIPCITLRPNTERPVTLTHGTNHLFDGPPAGLVAEVRSRLADPVGRPPIIERWDGRAAERIVDVLEERL